MSYWNSDQRGTHLLLLSVKGRRVVSFSNFSSFLFFLCSFLLRSLWVQTKIIMILMVLVTNREHDEDIDSGWDSQVGHETGN